MYFYEWITLWVIVWVRNLLYYPLFMSFNLSPVFIILLLFASFALSSVLLSLLLLIWGWDFGKDGKICVYGWRSIRCAYRIFWIILLSLLLYPVLIALLLLACTYRSYRDSFDFISPYVCFLGLWGSR